MRIKINNNLLLSENARPIIVAEISGNHLGKKSLFLKHIKLAAKSGADMVKIQTYEAKDITANNYDEKFYIRNGTWKGKRLWDLYSKACTPFAWHKDAFKLAKKLKITLFSSPFSERAVNFLEKFKVPVYKIASFEITDLNLINIVARTKKPVIISTGMATEKEIRRAVNAIKKYHSKIIILHCVSGYPTPEKQANVKIINKLKSKFKKHLIGLSDHTDNINSSLSATALGACLIEKHFKISKKLRSLDSKFSINPDQLKQLRVQSEKIFNALGAKNVKTKSIEQNSIKLRRSIFANKTIEKGEKLTKNNIICLRPKIGICSSKYFNVLNKKVKKKIKKNSPIFLNYLN